MGNYESALLGGMPLSGFRLYFYPEVTPSPLCPSPYDEETGFPGGRKERVMVATEEEMRSAKLELEDRDYCAHMLLKFRGCRKDNWPFAYRCAHEKHEYLKCKYDDYVIRMKDYERERRLKVIDYEISKDGEK